MKPHRLQELVTPFYLQMMRLNALKCDAALLADLIKTGHGVSPPEIVELLGDHWRHRVLGAWFALMHPSTEVDEALLTALTTSLGALDSPPLATAAVALCDVKAIPALRTYIAADVAAQWGGAGFASAALESLGEASDESSPASQDRDDFVAMSALARSLQDG